MTSAKKLRNHHFGRLNTGRMKIRGVMARKGDIPEYVNKMQQEVSSVAQIAGRRIIPSQLVL
jgi:transcriptional regulator with PAS, ATPase and Fis domain